MNRDTGVVEKTNAFASGSLGQRLRAFVRFGHTGEYGGWLGQAIAAMLPSVPACWRTPAYHCQSADWRPNSSTEKSFYRARFTRNGQLRDLAPELFVGKAAGYSTSALLDFLQPCNEVPIQDTRDCRKGQIHPDYADLLH